MTDCEIARELSRVGSSLFGCDGGNVRANLWVCGIEWGGNGIEPLREYAYSWYVTRSGLQIPFRREGEVPNRWRNSLYDLRLAGLCLRVFHRGQSKQQDYLLSRLYNYNSDIFKLNLYAYPCSNTDEWDGDAQRLTGCETKPEFRLRCERRFPLFERLLKSYRPKIVLCTGMSYRDVFLRAFAGQGSPAVRTYLRDHMQIYRAKYTTIAISQFRWANSLAETIKQLLAS